MQEQINEQNAKINMTVNDDSDFLSPYAETGKPVISSEVAEFLENSANAFHPKERITLTVHSNCIDDDEKIVYEKAIRNYFSLQLNEVNQKHAQKNNNSHLVFRRGNTCACVYVSDKPARDKRFVGGMRRYFCLGFPLGSGRPVFYRTQRLDAKKKAA